MKSKLILLCLLTLFISSVKAQLIQGTIKPGAASNEIEIWLKPNFSNSTAYLFQIGLPIAFPASTNPQPTGLNVTLDPTFVTNFGNNYSITVNPIANNTGNTEKYYNIVLIRGGAGASNAQTWTSGTEFKVLTASFAPSSSPNSQVKLADYQDGGSDGQGNFYTQSGTTYYVSGTSSANFYSSAGVSTAGGNASAGFSQTNAVIGCSNPIVASITGNTSLTTITTTQLADATAGGTWSSLSPGVATVNGSGLVTGVNTGSATIQYAVTNSCGTTTVSTTVNVSLPLIQGTVKPGSSTNEVSVWLKPNFSNSTAYLFQIGLPMAFPASASPQPTGVNVVLDPTFVTNFGSNYTVTVNPVAHNTGNTEKYYNIVLVRGGAGASNPQTWTNGTEFKVLTATFTYAGPFSTFNAKLADYQDGGSDGQGNFYTQSGSDYYVTSNSIGNFYAVAGLSSVGGNASAGYAQAINTCNFTVGEISGPTNACAYMAPGGQNATYSIATTSASTFTWTVPATATIISGQGTSSIQVHYGSSFVSGNVAVAITSACGGPTNKILAITKAAPTTPGTITGPSNACPYIGTATQVTYLIVAVPDAITYHWTLPPNVTLVSASSDSLTIHVTFGSGYLTNTNKLIKVKAISGCGNSADKSLTVTTAAPSTPAAMTGPLNACVYIGSTDSATYIIKKVTNATSYVWTVPAGVSIISHPGGTGVNDTIIRVKYDNSFASVDTIKVQASSTCGTSSARVLTIKRSTLATPGGITGPTDACPLMQSPTNPTGTLATYTIKKVKDATSYNWTVPTGVSINSHPGGSGVNDTIIAVKFDNTFITSTISVGSMNGCGAGGTRLLNVYKKTPITPGGITGPTDACPLMQSATNPTGTQATYTIKKVNYATSYTWAVPAGVTINSHPGGNGNNDTSIVVTYLSSFLSGSITVVANANCGSSSARALAILRKTSATPGTITGPTDACPLMGTATNVTYTIRKLLYATSYSWTVPAGASIVSHPGGAGVNDTIISVNYSNSFVNGNVSVTSSTNCSSSAPRTLTIIRKLPATPGGITITLTAACPGRQYKYTIPVALNATSYIWTAPTGGTIDSGQGTTTVYISYVGTAVNDTLRVVSTNNCSASAQRKLKILLAPCPGFKAPEQPTVKVIPVTTDGNQLEVTVMPNPSAEQFILMITSDDVKTPITLRVADINGRQVESKQEIVPGQTINVGAMYKQGIYIATLVQGGKQKTVKLVKL